MHTLLASTVVTTPKQQAGNNGDVEEMLRLNLMILELGNCMERKGCEKLQFN